LIFDPITLMGASLLEEVMKKEIKDIFHTQIDFP
jgi:hypothetical protein